MQVTPAEVHKRTAQPNELCEDNGEVLENADWASIINIERHRETGQYYLTFKRVKIRYKHDSDLTYFNHPFLSENRVKLIDDILMDEPLSELSLSTDLMAGGELVAVKGNRTNGEREIVSQDSDDAKQVFTFDKLKLRQLKKQIQLDETA